MSHWITRSPAHRSCLFNSSSHIIGFMVQMCYNPTSPLSFSSVCYSQYFHINRKLQWHF